MEILLMFAVTMGRCDVEIVKREDQPMKRHMTLLGALAAAICFAQTAAAQDLVRVYAPETIPYIGTTTNYGYGVTPVYRSSNYAPATTTYYAPEVALPTTTYYAPGVVAPAVVPTTTYYAPYTTYYAPAAAVVPYTSYYGAAPVYTSYYAPRYYGRAYYYAPAPLVPGQPVRNAFRAMTW
jgi:hypothetical protein